MQEQAGGMVLRAVEYVAPWFPGAIGAIFSLRFISGSKWQKVTAFLLGVACAGYIGGWIIEYLLINPNSMSARGISFITGLFGFAIVMHATQQIPEVFNILLNWFKSTLDNFIPKGK